MRQLHDQLFPGDGEEHAAVLAAGVARLPDGGGRLLGREVIPALDGRDYIPGKRGHRMLTASFVTKAALYCRDEGLAYLAVHCHGGSRSVAFSSTDLASHERGYPALLDVLRGQPVGALVLAQEALAGDLWLPDGTRTAIPQTRILGRPWRTLYPSPPPSLCRADPTYDRQTRLFSDRGQLTLSQLKVTVIGAGGAGSLLIEYLARLGIGHLVIIDPDRIDVTNLPRVVGSTRWDARAWFTYESRPDWMRRLGRRTATPKVRIAARLARKANPKMVIEPIFGDITDSAVIGRLLDCDFVFLAADTMQARLVFNALVHQYLIPGAQVGAKVQADRKTGELLDVFTAYRPITPDRGCLWCNGLINTARLQEEALAPDERQAQRYVEDPTVVAPSVITLNATASAHAANDFLFTVLGLLDPEAEHDYLRLRPQKATLYYDGIRKDADCPECGHEGRFARGDAGRLPTRARP
ncbi:HesA/MoeB/ThiF family protein [Microbispora hainanensis]|uniref:HesA/MoeB/ThiF family protein n=1 Tax=Microbispora hainanensis TaxID=568844 RepID=UPI00340D25B3